MRHAQSLLLLVAITAGMTAPLAAAPATGMWGGDRTNAELTASGASIRQDCAEGGWQGPVTPDARGRFAITGTWTPHEPGPQAGDAMPGDGRSAARFEGHISGTTLHLTIHPASGPVQQLTLTAGQTVKLIRCL